MADRPDILIICTDQQHHAMLSCAGTPWVATPHLDALASGGARFARAYCSSPVCIPSRFSMWTGRMPSAIGMRGNGGRDLHPFQDQDDRHSMGHVLRAAGYDTWFGGKLHTPVQLSEERLGFTPYCSDEREGLATATAELLARPADRPRAVVASFINPHDICYHALRAFASSDFDRGLVAKAVPEITALDAALRLPPDAALPPLPANHAPQQDEPSLIAELVSRRSFREQARARWTERDWRLHLWAYARLVERVDAQIGEVLAGLERSGRADRTLVLMTSDHGDLAAAHGLEHKTLFYDEAARVPLLARWPGRIPAGRVVDGVTVSTGIDLLATVCDAAGVAVPPTCLGSSLLPLADGTSTAFRSETYGENVISRMVVDQRWKYVVYDGGTHAEQLYDLHEDPGETRNHLAAHPGEAARLRAALERHRAAHAALALGPLRGSADFRE